MERRFGDGGARAPVRVAIIVLVAAALAGCGGVRRAALREDPPEVPVVAAPVPLSEPAPEPVVVAPEPVPVPLPVQPVQVQAHVAQRMPRQPPAVQRKVAAAVLAESKRARVDPLLVLAMIHVESSFNSRAVSRAGAVGLMQVRVPTIREQLERPRARRSDALDPTTNVQGGVRYLRRLLDRFGATDLALMAYNAGPGRIAALLSRGAIPMRFRDYPRKVTDELERLRVALRLLPPPAARTTLAVSDPSE